MPHLPKAPSRPWIPTAQAKPRPSYQQHAARSAEYGTARWQKARLAQLSKQPCCALCTKQGRTTAATVADHITPVRLGGDMWDSANHQSLCRSCHQAKSRRERDLPPPSPRLLSVNPLFHFHSPLQRGTGLRTCVMSTLQIVLAVYLTLGGLVFCWFYKQGTYAQSPANYLLLFLTWPVPLLGGGLYVIRYKRAETKLVQSLMQSGLSEEEARQEAATRLANFR